MFNSNTFSFNKQGVKLSWLRTPEELTMLQTAEKMTSIILDVTGLKNRNRLLCYVVYETTNNKPTIMLSSFKRAQSFSLLHRHLTWYEREVSEFFPIIFSSSCDTRNLLLPYTSKNPISVSDSDNYNYPKRTSAKRRCVLTSKNSIVL